MRNERGYGIANLLLTLAVGVALSYFVMRMMQSSKPTGALDTALDPNGASSSVNPSSAIPAKDCREATEKCSVPKQ